MSRHSRQTPSSLTRQQIYEFRQMAKHPDIVEKVIAESTDDSPASRRKVLRAIAAEEGRQSAPHKCVCRDCGAVHRRRNPPG